MKNKSGKWGIVILSLICLTLLSLYLQKVVELSFKNEMINKLITENHEWRVKFERVIAENQGLLNKQK